MDILTTLSTVALLLIYAVPGYILIKTKCVDESAVKSISKIMLFVCQPCFSVYAFNRLDFSWKFLGQVISFMAIITVVQIIIIVSFSLIYKKKYDDVKYRIATIASCFGNCVFFGAPVLEALLPQFPEAIVYANAYAVAMNLLGWTVGSAIITKDKKYISMRKVICNPATIGFICAIVLYVVRLRFPDGLQNTFSTLGRMTTPLSMIVLGMRLATVPIKPMFTTPLYYGTIVFKQMLYPIIGLGVVSLFPFFSADVKATAFILCACPVASVVFNFAELLGDGQEHGAYLFLLGTLGSIMTMPLILLVL